MNALAAEGAPKFTEMDLFKIPADAGFDPAKPFRLQLLVFRQVAAIDKAFTTFEAGFAATFTSFPNITFVPALRAGLCFSLSVVSCGMTNFSVFFTSV